MHLHKIHTCFRYQIFLTSRVQAGYLGSAGLIWLDQLDIRHLARIQIIDIVRLSCNIWQGMPDKPAGYLASGKKKQIQPIPILKSRLQKLEQQFGLERYFCKNFAIFWYSVVFCEGKKCGIQWYFRSSILVFLKKINLATLHPLHFSYKLMYFLRLESIL